MRRHDIPALALSLALSACTTVDLSSSDQPIIGGQNATTTEFPTVVALENSPGNWFCTGTLVDKDWVLTAAHCVEGETASGVKIRFDDDNVGNTSGGRVVAVAEIHGHPGYDGYAWDNDIAVIKLAQPVTDRAVTPIHRTTVGAATSITDVGYGDSDNNGGGAGILRKVVVSTADCAQVGDPSVSNANVLCFDGRLGKSSCYGDSGGPAFVTVNGKLEVAGVTSGGTADECTGGWDIYTSVAAELSFVDMFVPPVVGPTDPGDGSGSGSDTGSGSGSGSGDESMGGDDAGSADVGGCAVGAEGTGASSLLLVGVVLAARRRRRR
ncbi:MAG: serine protease [Kofleriaceae bacterium]|nr:serine protease [Kofleriaceae bacterium]